MILKRANGYMRNRNRVYKLTGVYSTEEINGNFVFSCLYLEDAVMYPNPYITVTRGEYTKHYFTGSERIATVMGGGQWLHKSPIEKLYTQHDSLLVQSFYDRWQESYLFAENGDWPWPTTNTDIHKEEDLGVLQNDCELPHIDNFSWVYWEPNLLEKVMWLNLTKHDTEDKRIFHYHGDHLGSAAWITEFHGDPIQYIHYLPYGEIYTNQMLFGYNERFKFTGKELDEETGYYYFIARYLHSVLGFLSPDPLLDKYPGITSYAYCGWNPIGNIDMHGDSIFIVQGRESILYRDGNLYNSDNTLYSGKLKRYTKSVIQAFNTLSALDEGYDLISELQNSSNNFYVKKGNNSFTASKTIASFGNIADLQELNPRLPTTGSGGIILWNPYSQEGGVNEKGETTRPPFIGLGHELAHARDANRGLLYPSNDSGKYTSSFEGVLKSEWRAVYVENILRSQAKLPLRTHYMRNTEGIGIGPLMISPAGKPIKYP